MDKKDVLLDGNINKIYFSYLIPTILAVITTSVYVLVDVYFVAVYLGSEKLAAFNIAMPIYTVYACLSMLFAVGGATTISLYEGMGKKSEANKVFSLTVISVVIIGIICSVVGVFTLEETAKLFGATEELLPYTVDYLKPIVALSFLFIINICMQILIRVDYNPKLSMIASVSGSLSNIVLDYIFVVELEMDLFGASLATALGPVLSMSILAFHYILKKNTTKLIVKCLDFKLYMQIIKNGLGTSILELSAGSIIFLFNIALLAVSNSDSVAIYGIISNVTFIIKGVFNGISQSAQPILSTNFGALKFDRLKKVNSVMVNTGLVVSIVSIILIFVFPSQIMGVFIGEYDYLMDKASDILLISSTMIIFFGLNTAIMYYFQSIGNGKISTLIAFLRGFFFIVVGLLVLTPSMGENGVWFTATFAEVMTLLVAYPLKRLNDKKIYLKYHS